LTLYHVSVKCPHCNRLTFVEEMPIHQLDQTRALLMPVLHALVCGHCQKQFGRQGNLVPAAIEAGRGC